MKKVEYDTKPMAYEKIDNNLSYYRWDIVQKVTEERISWECFEVTVCATVTKEKITKEVLNALYPNQQEEKLINDYNAVQLGVCDSDQEELFIARYVDFLNVRKTIKEQIEEDCLTFRIF